jgi:hypothetical protein
MTTQNTKKTKFAYQVRYAYDYDLARPKGTIYSKHHTYDAARSSAIKSGFDSFLEIYIND